MPLANNKPAERGDLDKKKTVACGREEQAAECLHRLCCALMDMHGRIHKHYSVVSRSEAELVALWHCRLGDGCRVPALRLSRQYEPCRCSDGGVRWPPTRETGKFGGKPYRKRSGTADGCDGLIAQIDDYFSRWYDIWWDRWVPMCVFVCAQTITSGAVQRANRRFVHTQTPPTQSKLIGLSIHKMCFCVFRSRPLNTLLLRPTITLVLPCIHSSRCRKHGSRPLRAPVDGELSIGHKRFTSPRLSSAQQPTDRP